MASTEAECPVDEIAIQGLMKNIVDLEFKGKKAPTSKVLRRMAMERLASSIDNGTDNHVGTGELPSDAHNCV